MDRIHKIALIRLDRGDSVSRRARVQEYMIAHPGIDRNEVRELLPFTQVD